MNPSGRLIAMLLAASVVVVFIPVLGVPLYLGVAPTIVVIVASIIDRFVGCQTQIEATRQVNNILSVGTENKVTITLRNLSNYKANIEVADSFPTKGKVNYQNHLHVTLKSLSSHNVDYVFTPEERGKFFFEEIQIRHSSLFGMWNVKRFFLSRKEVTVFPNIHALKRYELLAQKNNLAQMGIRSVRMKGEGTEFERMREYRQGDEPRNVDWKTTARLGKLVVREMGQERNQNILFLIDMGRMMRQTTNGLSHFDLAVNTAIILGHVAQTSGDNVGAILFADKVYKYIPLSRGALSVESIVHAVYDLKAQEVATDYTKLFSYIAAKVSRRSLLLLMTHRIAGEEHILRTNIKTPHICKHLPVCLFFREPSVELEVQNMPRTKEETFHWAAAADSILDRKQAILEFNQMGIMALDAHPGEYSAIAINQYLDIKARNLL